MSSLLLFEHQYLSQYLCYYFSNINISVTIYVIDLNISVCLPNVLWNGNMSHNCDLCISFYLMSKSDSFWAFMQV